MPTFPSTVLVTYYDPSKDELFQSEIPAADAEIEKSRVLFSPWVMEVGVERNHRLPLRDFQPYPK